MNCFYQEKRYSSTDFIDFRKKTSANQKIAVCFYVPRIIQQDVFGEQWELERMVSLCQQYDVFYFLMKFIWISLIKAMFIDQLRNLII